MNKIFKSLQVPALLLMLALSACAKKDSDYASKYATNGVGAKVKDGSTAVSAAENAFKYGVTGLDIIDFHRTTNGVNTTMAATIVLNNRQISVTTSHAGSEIREGSTQLGSYSVRFHAMCGNSVCDPYFAAVEVYSGSNLVIQQGIRVNFDIPSMSVYQYFSPNEARTFYYNSMANTKGVVGYLNSTSTSTNSSVTMGGSIGL